MSPDSSRVPPRVFDRVLASRTRHVIDALVRRDGPVHYRRMVHPEVHYGVREVMHEAEVAHRLLDWARVSDGPPQGGGDLDSRVAELVDRALEAESHLAAIASAHAPGPDKEGQVTGFCGECGKAWPCPTYEWASGRRDATMAWDPADGEAAADEAAGSTAPGGATEGSAGQ